MHIRKDTWHYRVWRFTYLWGSDRGVFKHLPKQTNLCSYVSRTILMPIPLCIVIGIVAALCVCIVVVGNVGAVLSGTGFFWIDHEPRVVYYFPKLTLRKRQVAIRPIVLSFYGVLAVATIVYLYPWTILIYAGYGLATFCVFALVYIVIDGSRRVGRWSGWSLFKEYLKAKKMGVCPLLTFDEPNLTS